MTGYINVICESLLLALVMVFVLAENCKDKRRGFAAYLLLELMNGYILFRILWMTEKGIALPQVVVWRIVLYAVYIAFRLGWFLMFTENPYRNFLLTYFYIWISIYTAAGGFYWLMNMILPEKTAVDVMSIMPRTYLGLILHLLSLVVIAVGAVWIKRRNWLQKLPTSFLCVLFFFIFVFADVGTAFLMVKSSIKTETYMRVHIVNVLFLLVTFYFGYINYLKASARKENEKIQKIIEDQYRAYESLSRKENEIRKIRHDLANHLQAIKGMEGNDRKRFSEHYQEQMRKIYEGINQNGIFRLYEGEVKQKRIPNSVAWGIFTVFVADMLMVIIVSQLILYRVFAYESIIIMEFMLIFFITFQVWVTWRRTKKENKELSKKISDSIESPDTTKLLGYLDDIISNLEGLSVQDEETALKRLDHTEFSVITENPVLDSMLRQKNNLCREQSIVLEMEWNLSGAIGMDDMDIIGLAGNLLDNAIEACSRVEGRQRIIQIRSNKHANIMSIRVRNTKNEAEEPIKNRFRTLKDEKENHGIGMKIIQSIVNKYDGTIQYYDEKTEFTVLVNLQVD